MTKGFNYEYAIACMQYDTQKYIGNYIKESGYGKVNAQKELRSWLLVNYLDLILHQDTRAELNLLKDEQIDNVVHAAEFITNNTYNYTFAT